MSRKKPDPKGRRKAGLPLGIAGMTLLASVGAVAAAQASSAVGPQREIAPAVNLSEEEIFDVSTASFYVIDRENPGGQRVAQNSQRKSGSKKRSQQPWSMQR